MRMPSPLRTAAAGALLLVLNLPLAPAVSAQGRAGLPDFTDLYERNGPAVVSIDVTQKSRRGRGMPELSEDDPFYEFFRRFGQVPPRRGQEREPEPQAVGSGFVIGSDGHVLTNAHVVDGADEVTVKLHDQREFKAKVLGVDKTTDVAVLRIEAKGLPAVRTGDAAKTRVGEWVVAIGAPYGLENTVTSGIVSAKSRSLPGDSVVPFIQTDAAVNPGNSGGPLFNLDGEVIGINSQIFSRSGGFQGLAFAIPIDVALDVKDQIVRHGKVSHGKLGVTVQEVNQALAESFGMDKPAGALVGSVQKGGPAAKAGLEPGDVIVKFDGKPIARSGDLPPLVTAVKPGSSVKLEVWRDGKPVELSATVGTLDDGKVAKAADAEEPKGKLGVAVRPLSPDEQKAGGRTGLVVEKSGGAAAKAGVQAGDVIVGVGSTKITTIDELRAQVDKAGKTVALLIERQGRQIYVPVKVG